MAAAVDGGLLAGSAGLLEGFQIKLQTSGFGKSMSDFGVRGPPQPYARLVMAYSYVGTPGERPVAEGVSS